MNREQCIQSLQQIYREQQPTVINVSKLTSDAWWADKPACFSELWWTQNIGNILENTSFTDTNTSQEVTNLITETQTPVHSAADNSWWFAWSSLLWIWIGLLWAYTLFVLIRKLLVLWYDVLNRHRIVWLKVRTPRWDGKVDMEQNKELAKDMKEKIGRMSQVFRTLHKMWSLNVADKIKNIFFKKSKITITYHYEEWSLYFLVATYPEYLNLVEWAINAQYSEASIEIIDEPNFFAKKHHDIIPLETQLDNVYTIKMYKRATDDQINNVIDAMSNISRYDTASIVITMKPAPEAWNKEAQKKANLLYKDIAIESRWKKFIMPRKLFSWLFFGKNKNDKNPDDVTFVRMVKAKEDSINDMAEEAGNPWFVVGITIVVSSDNKINTMKWIENIVGAFNVYNDEYANEFEHPVNKADILWFIAKPIWKWWVVNLLNGIFVGQNVLSANELTSIFHFPARVYNRSNIIDRMPYKVLPAPQWLPVFKEENGFIMSGIVAESYKWWDLSQILDQPEYEKHWAVWERSIEEEQLIPRDTASKKEQKDGETIEKDGKKYIKKVIQKTLKWYKLFKEWVLLGVNIYKNKYTPVYMKRNDRTRHHYCIGKSGTGKSVYLQTIARQDIWNNDGLCLIDPHGDLAEDMLKFIPKERAKDVIYFDAWNEERPMGLNLYEIDSLDEADRAVNDATEIFLKMFGPEIFGPRIQEYFKYGSLTLLEDFEDRPTILDVTRLYTDEAYRNYKVKKVTNPVVRNFWEKTYNAMWDREKQEIIPYFSSKFVSFNTNRLIRNIIGQTESAFKIDEIMNSNKILLINLSKGKIGELNAQLLGMILVSKIYNGAMARAKIPEEERKDFYLYVDEFQNFISWTFADILSEARKYRLSLIMAHQYIWQLEGWGGNSIGQDKWGKSDVKAAVFGNVGTLQSFKVGAPDAEFLEKEYVPTLSAGDIVWIANYKAYIKLNVNNTTTRPFSMNSIYTNDYKNKKIVPILKEYCAKKYWRKREFVDAEINARLGMSSSETEADTLSPSPTEPKTPNTPADTTSQNTTEE